jgi:hypothetical protein
MWSDEDIEAAAMAMAQVDYGQDLEGMPKGKWPQYHVRAVAALNAVQRWRPIEEWPDEVYDGRRMLAAYLDRVTRAYCQHVVFWNPYNGGFWQAGGIQVHPTHLAPLLGPPTND